MYRLLLLLCFFIVGQAVQAQWRPARSPLSTNWAMGVSPENALPEYPRPQMQRFIVAVQDRVQLHEV